MWRVSILAICLTPAAASVFAGRVVEDHSGNPLPRAEIRITRPHATAIVAELETDIQGRFRTPELPDAEYVLRFSKADFSTLEAAAHAGSGMLVRLTRFGAIAGKIVDLDGRSVEAQVVALTESDAIAGTADRNASRGEYRIYDLPPGIYRVAILTSGEWPSRHGILLHPREFTVSGGEDYTGADFTLPGGPAFRVSAKADSTRAGSVLYTLVAADHPGRQLAQQLVSADRPFTVEDVRPGNYEFLASANTPGSPPVFGRTPVTVVAANVEDVRVPLDQVRSASFTLRTQEPCATDAIVELKAREAWLPNRPVSVAIQAGKTASLTALAPARYAIAAKAARGNCFAAVPPDLDLTRDSASRPVEVVLAPPGSVQGHLTGAAHPANYVVVLTPRDRSMQRIAFPDENGGFAFPDLAPGSYSLLAAGPNTRWTPAPGREPPPADVSGGAPTALELHVSEAAR